MSDDKTRREQEAVRKAGIATLTKSTARTLEINRQSKKKHHQQAKTTVQPTKAKPGDDDIPMVAKTKITPVPRKGMRKIPTPCDDHGCRHMGLSELMALPKVYLKAYTKEGKWLVDKPCKDCASKKEDEEGRVMDVETLLRCKDEPAGDIARYCNCGPVAHSMEEEDEYKANFLCDMVLCKGCYRKRVNEYEKKTMASGRRSSRRTRKGPSPN